MASQQPGIPVTSSGVIQRRTVPEMLQEVSQRIQSFGPGPISTEQAQELEKLKLIYAKLLKSQGDVIITHQQPVASHAQVAMTTQPGNLAQGQQLLSAVQRIVPAAAAPVTSAVTILPQGSKITVTNPTTLTTAQIQQIHALSQGQTGSQAHTVQVLTSPLTVSTSQQHKVGQEQAKITATGQTMLAPGQRMITSASPVTVAAVTSGLKTPQGAVQAGIKLAGQSSSTVVPLQRQLAPNKIQTGISVSQSIQSIAPSTTISTTAKSLVSHAGITNRVETPSPQPQQVLTKRRIQELLHEIDPQEQMDDDVEDLLLQIADDFIESVVNASCQIAKHRKSNTLEVKDVQLHLERSWNMWIPGFGSDELRPYKKAATTEAHKQRLALIRKSLKK